MTGHLGSVLGLLAASSSSKTASKSSPWTLILLFAVFILFYFVYLRPRQQKARQQREEGQRFEVGDEVLTVGGIVGRVLDITDDRVTIVTGASNEEGQLSGAPPYRIELVRQGIARRLTAAAAEEPAADEEPDEEPHEEPEGEDAAPDDEGGEEAAS